MFLGQSVGWAVLSVGQAEGLILLRVSALPEGGVSLIIKTAVGEVRRAQEAPDVMELPLERRIDSGKLGPAGRTLGEVLHVFGPWVSAALAHYHRLVTCRTPQRKNILIFDRKTSREEIFESSDACRNCD